MSAVPDGLVSLSQAAASLGLSTDAARKMLARGGVQSVARQPGRGGESLYRRAEVEAAAEARPGRGVGGGRPRRSAD